MKALLCTTAIVLVLCASLTTAQTTKVYETPYDQTIMAGSYFSTLISSYLGYDTVATSTFFVHTILQTNNYKNKNRYFWNVQEPSL